MGTLYSFGNKNLHIRNELMDGKQVTYKACGNSMTPIIKSGQKVTLKPIKLSNVKKGDAVFCKVKGNFFIHLVTAVRKDQVQISNNHGHVNGWTSQVYGILIKVEN